MKRTEIKYFKSGSGRIVITDIKYCASMNLIEVEFGKSVRYEDGSRDSFDLPVACEKDQFERLVKTMKQAGENLTRLRSEDLKTVLI
jgi:LEA14-like dessication related protein